MEDMKITHQRFNHDHKSTAGLLFIDGEFECFTVEDTKREIKVDGETRIPKGTYEIKFREVLSGKTKQYRKDSWFTWHLEIQDVPDFQYCYLHRGNKSSHSEGCILVGNSIQKVEGEWFTGSSTQTFEKFYKKVKIHLEKGGKVTIEILDEESVTTPF